MTGRIPNLLRRYQRVDLYRMTAVMLCYPSLYLLSLKISAFHHVGDIIWLPGGISLALLLLYGRHLWPGIYLGALAGSFCANDPWPASLLIALGNTLSPLTGAYLLSRHSRLDLTLRHTRDISLLVFGGLVATLAGTLVGAPPFLLASHIPQTQHAHLFIAWWMSDFIGVVLLTPLLLLFATRSKETCMILKRPIESTMLFLGAIVASLATQSRHFSFFSTDSLLLLVPFFVWAAARLGQRGTALTALVIYAVHLLATTKYNLTSHTAHHGWSIWLEATIMTLCSQFIAVMFNERDQIAQQLREGETRYKSLVNNARDAILVANLDGHLEQINLAGEALLGYSQEEIRRLRVPDIHPEADRSIIWQYFERVVQGHIEPLETRIRSKSGKTIDVEVRPCLVEINGRKYAQGVFIDLTERKRIEAERMAQEKVQRDTLIREVHHRIKNNLQGITGVLRMFAQNHPQAAQPITEAIGQVQSIALIHGIKMNLDSRPITLCALIKPIASNNQTLWSRPVLYHTPPCRTDHCEEPASLGCCLTISENETVPLALILNELITNAVKHSAPGSTVEIALVTEPVSKNPVIRISNHGSLNKTFDFDQKNGLGTGLQLVKTLLPNQGIKLSWQEYEHQVVTSVQLSSPVII